MNYPARIVAHSMATSKGQTTIPKAMREAAGIKDGTQLTWIFEDGAIKIVAKTLNIADFAGFLGKPPSGVQLSVEEMDEAIGEAVAERFERKTAR